MFLPAQEVNSAVLFLHWTEEVQRDDPSGSGVPNAESGQNPSHIFWTTFFSDILIELRGWGNRWKEYNILIVSSVPSATYGLNCALYSEINVRISRIKERV